MSITQYRKAKGFTQEYMAEKLNITTAAYCLYENGKRSIPNDVVEEIIKLLQIPKGDADNIFLPKTFAICKNESEQQQ